MARLRKRLDGSPFNCLSVHETSSSSGRSGGSPRRRQCLQASTATERGGSAGIEQLRHMQETSRDVAEAVVCVLSMLGSDLRPTGSFLILLTSGVELHEGKDPLCQALVLRPLVCTIKFCLWFL